MVKDFVELARNFVEEECRKPTSKYGYEPFENHFLPVYEYAMILAEEFNANKEILGIAAWMHDIGSIIHGRKKHHIKRS